MTLGRLCIAIILIAFVTAEIWRPTLLRPKEESTRNLVVVSAERVPYGRQTTLGRDLLDDLPRIDALPLGNIDAVLFAKRTVVVHDKAELSVRRTEDVRIVGWFADSQSRAPGSALFPIIDGRRYGNADLTYGSIRPDVGRFFQTPALEPTGFALLLPAGSLAPGRHRVQFGLVSSDRRGFFQAPEALFLNASQ